MKRKTEKAHIEAERNKVARIWWNMALDIMKSMLQEYEDNVTNAEKEYKTAINSDDWEEDEEKREKILSLLKEKVEIEIKRLEARKEQINAFAETMAILAPKDDKK